jgi:site-specific recombinase XerD
MIEELKERYMGFNQSLSPTTLKSYEWAFNRIIHLWNKYPNVDMKYVDVEEVQQFISLLYDKVDKHKPKVGYPKRYCSFYYLKMFLKRLFRFIGRDDIVKVLKENKLESPELEVLSFEEINNVVGMLDDVHREHTEDMQKKRGAKVKTNPPRDGMIILTLFSTGLRARELISLKVGDIDFEGKKGKVKSKGRRREKDNFYFMFKFNEKLKEWLGDRINNKTEYIFLDNNQQSFTYWNLWELMKIVSDNTGFKFTCHSLRHSAGVYLIKHNWTPEMIRKFLRHRQIETTGIYLKEKGELDIIQGLEGIKDRIL